MAMDNFRVDATFVGYVVIAAMLLMFGFFGLELTGIFGDLYNYSTMQEVFTTLPLSPVFIYAISLVGAVALLFVAVSSYKSGNKSAMALFGAFGALLLFLGLFGVLYYAPFMAKFAESGLSQSSLIILFASGWIVWLGMAIMFVFFALSNLADGQPKFVAVLEIVMALFFLFMALYFLVLKAAFFSDAQDYGMAKAMGAVAGIFGFLGFFLATYIGLAYSSPKSQLPLI